jgi:hypothetical protein
MLVWERKAYRCVLGGMFLSGVLYGALMGTAYGPRIGAFLGFSDPQSVEDPFQEAWLIMLTLAALLLTIFSLWKLRLIRNDAA